jgi:hypothetical protein
MAFTNVSLNTQTLLETTFISDMRLILNANVAVVKGKLEDVINTLEIDLVNKYIGVDNYVNQVKTNNVILGNGITFMDSTNVIGTLTKNTGKSILSIDKLIIQAGGSIDMTGAANTMAIARLGVGIALADITEDGFFVGKTGTPVLSKFYGEAKFPYEAITQSTEGPGESGSGTNTELTTTASAGSTYYYANLVLGKASKQFIYLTIKAGDTSPDSSKPIYIFLNEDISNSAANRSNNGQTFTIVIKEYQTSASVTVAPADWGKIYIMPGYQANSNQTKIAINGDPIVSASTVANAITELTAAPTSERQYIQMYNGNIQSPLGSSDLGGVAHRQFGASVSLTRFGAITSGARYVVTGSHNIRIVN